MATITMKDVKEIAITGAAYIAMAIALTFMLLYVVGLYLLVFGLLYFVGGSALFLGVFFWNYAGQYHDLFNYVFATVFIGCGIALLVCATGGLLDELAGTFGLDLRFWRKSRA